jgi:hypothetical protein
MIRRRRHHSAAPPWLPWKEGLLIMRRAGGGAVPRCRPACAGGVVQNKTTLRLGPGSRVTLPTLTHHPSRCRVRGGGGGGDGSRGDSIASTANLATRYGPSIIAEPSRRHSVSAHAPAKFPRFVSRHMSSSLTDVSAKRSQCCDSSPSAKSCIVPNHMRIESGSETTLPWF